MSAHSISRAIAKHPVAFLTGAAILLRLALFTGRGSYVAFDEGWYLLLGRNLWSGAGYTLSGLDHVTLSPLFPILAGAVDRVIGSVLWAGRIVAAVAGGLLVIPCWSVFRRTGGRRVAWIGASFVAAMPSLAPFVVPYWIGWELWAGAEPLLHLFLFAGIAFFLLAWQKRRVLPGIACGLMFGLAYLSRPEAIVVFALVGVAAFVVALATRATSRRLLASAVACALAFVLVAAPYWSFLHDRLDRWTLSGRGVHVSVPVATPSTSRSSSVIERMLWNDDEAYLRTLYGLDESGTRLASDYWGVARDGAVPTTRSETAPVAQPTRPQSAPADPPPNDSVADDANDAARADAPANDAARADAPAGDARGGRFVPAVGRYFRTLGIVVPWFLWPVAVLGLFVPGERRRPARELLVGAPLATASLLIAALVATDPRTQLFLAPLVAFYAARGTIAVGRAGHRWIGREMRPHVAVGLVAATLAVALVGINARRLYLSLAVGSPHHIVATENVAVAEALRETAPVDATVMSWHPAIALFADRDWRVLPYAPFDRVIRFARTQPEPIIVLSVFYPPPILRGDDAPHYLVVPVPAELPAATSYRIEMTRRTPAYATGIVRAVETMPSP